MRLISILAYPIKSTTAVEVTEIELDQNGIPNDRRLMVVAEDGTLVTQKKFPKLALVRAQISGDELIMSAPGRDSLTHSISLLGEQQPAEFYFDRIGVIDQGDITAQWLSDFLGTSCRLVVSRDNFGRTLPQGLEGARGAFPRQQPRFTDVGSLHLTTEASLADLNHRLEVPVAMNRFRPNLIVDGEVAFAEDRWKRLRIGEVELEGTMTCERCVITNNDQNTANRSKEPFRTLTGYRRFNGGFNGGVIFGIYLNVIRPGRIRVGQSVELLETGQLLGASA